MDEHSLVSWDWYDEALLGLSCYPSNNKKGKYIEYDRVWGHTIKYLRFLEAIVQKFKGHRIIVLDIGCADGRFARMMTFNTGAFEHINYIGVDIRGDIVGRVAKDKCNLNKNIKTEFVTCDICERWPFSAQFADIIVMSQVLRYMKEENGRKILKNGLETLKSTGIALITHSVPSKHDFSDWAGYIGALNINQFRDLLIQTGYSIKDEFPVETGIMNKRECEMLALEKAPNIFVLPQPLRVLIGLHFYPDLAQQQAFLAMPAAYQHKNKC